MQLHRADVLDGALTLLDADGLDGLTTRKLAAYLGVRPGALYWHFKSRQLLIDAMADRLLDGVAHPTPRGSWRHQLEVLAGRYRSALLSHRDGARVVAGSYVAQPNTVTTGTAFIRTLTSVGLPADRAGWTWSAIKYYILGHCIEEQARQQLERSDEWKAKDEEITRVGESADPSTATALRAVLTGDPTAQFAHGLSLLLAGIDDALPAGRE